MKTTGQTNYEKRLPVVGRLYRHTINRQIYRVTHVDDIGVSYKLNIDADTIEIDVPTEYFLVRFRTFQDEWETK